MSRIIKIAVSTLPVFALVAVSALSAGEPKGSDTKGRHYYRESCKECHVKGGKGGEVSPLSRTQAQWRTYFEKGKHAKGAEPLTKFVPDEKMRDLKAFLINHAADSLQPETCGR